MTKWATEHIETCVIRRTLKYYKYAIQNQGTNYDKTAFIFNVCLSLEERNINLIKYFLFGHVNESVPLKTTNTLWDVLSCLIIWQTSHSNRLPKCPWTLADYMAIHPIKQKVLFLVTTATTWSATANTTLNLLGRGGGNCRCYWRWTMMMMITLRYMSFILRPKIHDRHNYLGALIFKKSIHYYLYQNLSPINS